MLARFIGGPAHDETADVPMRRVKLGGRGVDIPPRYVLVAVLDDGALVQLPPAGSPTTRDVLNWAAGRWDTYTTRGGPQPRNDGLLRLYWRPSVDAGQALCLDAAAAIRQHLARTAT